MLGTTFCLLVYAHTLEMPRVGWPIKDNGDWELVMATLTFSSLAV